MFEHMRFYGAGSRGRTDTVSLPTDFESVTSANSITPAYCHINLPQILLFCNSFIPSLQEFCNPQLWNPA